ncbi:MAG: hypothetical protein DHS20C02_05230 [Micavibrio sp.]|nr:MAG: hypothetical protein DHS20C02_05230 [Micavibrio sp.]
MAADVEVNLDALDDIREYRPPPMFDPQRPPLTGYSDDNGEVKTFPLEIETRENSLNPEFKPHITVAPKEPKKDDIVLTPMAPVKPVEKIPVYKLTTPEALIGHNPSPTFGHPPVPEKKPHTEKTAVLQPILESQISDIEPAASRLPPLPKKRPAKLHASKSFIEQTLAARQPITRETLIEPSAQDVLASIEKNIDKEIEAPPIIDEPEPPPALAPEPRPIRQARKQPTSAPKPMDVEYSAQQIISFPFAPGVTELDQKTRKTFDNKALQVLKQNPDLRIQVQAYATPSGDGQSSARRLSLSRAISIRAYLIEKDIDPKRIDVRALGTQTKTQPLDRVDLVFFDKNNVL